MGTRAEQDTHDGNVTLAVLVNVVGFDIGQAAIDLVLTRRMEVVLGELIGVVSDAQRIGDARRDRHLDIMAGVFDAEFGAIIADQQWRAGQAGHRSRVDVDRRLAGSGPAGGIADGAPVARPNRRCRVVVPRRRRMRRDES